MKIVKFLLAFAGVQYLIGVAYIAYVKTQPGDTFEEQYMNTLQKFLEKFCPEA